MVDIKTLETELSDLGVARENAAARRQAIFGELRQLSIKAEAGDNKARNAQGPLNKEVEELSRLIIRIDREMKDAKRSIDLCRGQAAVMAAHKHAAESSSMPKDLLFEVLGKDGRRHRHRHYSANALQAELIDGFRVTAQIFGADDAGLGGFCVAVGQRAELLKYFAEMSDMDARA
jgi:hypothetical protein